ncbi:MAG: ATP-binding cassette domain-containing protein [Flavobacteriaceae bacterium]|nr:ATP-binding cassette domain-containing protein [Flavobacteriaceae bacterium]
MIEIKNIEKRFNDNYVLKNMTHKFEQGKTNLIIGESGSGKTTLLKILVGLYKNDNGSVLFDGIDVNKMKRKVRKSLRQEIGMLFQGGALYDYMTVEENIMFPLTMFTEKTEEEKLERVNFCLNRVNLDGKNHLMPSELSGGMMKRVSIARAIVMEPKYLLCDEPNSGLDPKTSILIDNLIQEITEDYNITTVINTHDMNSVMEIGKKIVFLQNGKKAWEGTKEDIFNTDNKAVSNFVYSSDLFKKVREVYLKT